MWHMAHDFTWHDFFLKMKFVVEPFRPFLSVFVSVLLSAHVERFSVSRMRDFFRWLWCFEWLLIFVMVLFFLIFMVFLWSWYVLRSWWFLCHCIKVVTDISIVMVFLGVWLILQFSIFRLPMKFYEVLYFSVMIGFSVFIVLLVVIVI